MNALKIKIIELVDDWQPGWVKCTFQDINKKEWVIVDKIPVITNKDLDKNSQYPIDEIIECKILNQSVSTTGEIMMTIDLSQPWGISEEGGQTVFQVSSSQLV